MFVLMITNRGRRDVLFVLFLNISFFVSERVKLCSAIGGGDVQKDENAVKKATVKQSFQYGF